MKEMAIGSYRFGFNKQEKDNEIKGEGNSYDFGARIYDSRLGRWLSVDPLAHKFPFQSPYVSMDNNPIFLIDPTGKETQSTHTDKNGKVIAVIDDGDKGVYKHGDNADGKSPTQYQIEKRQKKQGASAGGEKMGETSSDLGFADFEAYQKDGTIIPGEGAVIDFGSTWATNKVSSILAKNPTIGSYALHARTGGDYYIKRQAPKGKVYYGSLLYGKYASARDAGNFVAGAVAQKSIISNSIIDYGYGTFNQNNNDVGKSLLQIAGDVLFYIMPDTHGQAVYEMNCTANNGEDKLTKVGIELGKQAIKNTIKK